MGKQSEWLAAYVERCMRESLGDDADFLHFCGDVIAYRSGTAACIVRVEPGEPAMVRVLAKAVLGVRDSAKLLRELNEVNTRSLVANTWWNEGEVIVECSLFAEAVGVETLEQACLHVNDVANDIGVGMAAMYDGATPYPPFANDSEDAA